MDSINLMIEEHKNIKRMLLVVRKINYGILKGTEINYEDFAKVIDFVRNYADAYHHGKEEKILFKTMEEEIGETAEKLVKFGMLVEHDLGRFYISELEEALKKTKSGDEEAKLDVIANAVGYTHLLFRHIEKEDKVVYTFAKRKLSKETLENVDRECESFEKEREESNTHEKYIALLEGLEMKYGIS